MKIANALLKKWFVWRRDVCSLKSEHYNLLYKEQVKLNSTYDSTTYYDDDGNEFVMVDYTKNVPWFLCKYTTYSLASKYYDLYINYFLKANEYQRKSDRICA